MRLRPAIGVPRLVLVTLVRRVTLIPRVRLVLLIRLVPLGMLVGLAGLAVPGAAAEGRSAPSDMAEMAERLLSTDLPGRQPLDLATRLRGLRSPPAAPSPTAAAPLQAGAHSDFWILDQRSARLFQTSADLQLVTPHAYWFVQSDLADRAPQADLERSASIFETRTYPLIHRYFGSEPSPGIDGQSHVVFLLANVPGVAAYFSSADAYPRVVNPRSNEHDMIYVNLNALHPGEATFDSTLTHEFQHMAHFNRCPIQEGWVDEGASELAMRIAGYDSGPPQAFASRPDVQLTSWTTPSADLLRHYQASYLFVRYVAERGGGWDSLAHLFATCARGEALFNAFLRSDPIAPDMDGLFADWTTANLVQDASVADGRYAYAGGTFHAALSGSATRAAPFLGSVPQYAANYVQLPSGPGVATFSGDASVPLLAATATADSGLWWSNRGDNLDTRLTRSFDLSGLSQATLRFRAWYDTEDQFDFVYLSASTDGGRTWQALGGRHTVPDQATGNNYGEGWTGSSGGWVNEEVDLTPFAGQPVQVRFEYVTDQSYNDSGFAFEDLQVPELGLDEPGASDAGWDAEGWLRVDAPVPQHWNLRLVRWTGAGIQVDPVGVEADGSASLALDPTASKTVLVVAPTAPRTLLPANYSVTITD